MVWKIVLHVILSHFLGQMFCVAASQQCGSQYSVLNKMLRGHIFNTVETSISFECLQACDNDVRCQSVNYVISTKMCELNDRTKEAKPEDFIPNSDRYYFKRVRTRGKLSNFIEEGYATP